MIRYEYDGKIGRQYGGIWIPRVYCDACLNPIDRVIGGHVCWNNAGALFHVHKGPCDDLIRKAHDANCWETLENHLDHVERNSTMRKLSRNPARLGLRARLIEILEAKGKLFTADAMAHTHIHRMGDVVTLTAPRQHMLSLRGPEVKEVLSKLLGRDVVLKVRIRGEAGR